MSLLPWQQRIAQDIPHTVAFTPQVVRKVPRNKHFVCSILDCGKPFDIYLFRDCLFVFKRVGDRKWHTLWKAEWLRLFFELRPQILGHAQTMPLTAEL